MGILGRHSVPHFLPNSGESEYLNTRFLLPTMQCAGYSVKLKKKIIELIVENSILINNVML